MNHQHYKQWLQLLIYDELEVEQHKLLNEHLASCGECRNELEELKRLHALLANRPGVEPTDELLEEARQELRAALRLERTRQTTWQRVLAAFPSLGVPRYRAAFGGLVMLGVGVFAGYLAFAPSSTIDQQQQTAAVPSSPEGGTHITNVRFIDADASDGVIEFTFDAVAPVHIKGNVNDEQVQKVLTHAMLNDQNPGTRLRSVNAFASQMQNRKQPDRELKAALIGALTSDENPGVRKEALRVLQSFPFDDEIKNAFLQVLVHDKNSGLRIAAINGLDSARAPGILADQDILNVMKERMHSDDNSYVRIRAKAVLQEVRQ